MHEGEGEESGKEQGEEVERGGGKGQGNWGRGRRGGRRRRWWRLVVEGEMCDGLRALAAKLGTWPQLGPVPRLINSLSILHLSISRFHASASTFCYHLHRIPAHSPTTNTHASTNSVWKCQEGEGSREDWRETARAHARRGRGRGGEGGGGREDASGERWEKEGKEGESGADHQE